MLGSSQLARGALRAIREMGLRIPQDISLLSYDDPEWLQLCGPDISTIALPVQSMAHYAVNLIGARYRSAGYKVLYVDYDRSGHADDMCLSGPVLGLNDRF